jgi:Tfp pilus assembly protein PilN
MKILLNLLPEEKKNAIERGLHARILLWQFFMLFLLQLFLLGILVTVTILLTVEKESVVLLSQNSIAASQEDQKTLATYEAKFQGINEAIGVVSKFQGSHIYYSQLFRVLDNAQPQDVFLKQILTKDRTVTLIGAANTRENLLLFEEKLSASKCVENVNVPLSSLFSQKNLDFQLDFQLKLECLRQNTL